MNDILDPNSWWIGRGGRVIAGDAGNISPIAVGDTLTVAMDSGPVTVDVLANDFDIDGPTVTLISASAALGTAVAEAGGTVTYTPPAGISGSDTITYEIADDQNARATTIVAVTIQGGANLAPVAVDDVVSLAMDAGPITIDVLANDSDPDGPTVTLISAVAVAGIAVAEADGTVTYTPPAGVAGSDTITYEIADDQDARDTATVTVTITGPALTIDPGPNNTLVVNGAAGVVDITVTEPAIYAGTYQADTADLAGGPVNLVPPAILGTPDLGAVLTAQDGLWIFDTAAGDPVQTLQWQRGGADISGATGPSYTVTAADVGQGISLIETQTDSYGARSVSSPTIGAAFTPDTDAQLIAWYDADDAATITDSAGAVTVWGDKAGAADLSQNNNSLKPVTGARTLNGLNVLDFDGNDFVSGTLAIPASGDVAFHMVLAIDSTANPFEAIFSVDAANDFQVDANNGSQFDGRLNAIGIGTSVPLAGGPYSGAMVLSVVFDRTGAAQAEVFVSDTSAATMAYIAPIDPSVAFNIMTNRSRNAWVNGAVAEFAVTGNVTNRAQYHTYLSNKWGIA